MPVQMPGEDDLPPGPQRDFTEAIHKLYQAAGCPGLRQMSKSIRRQNDLPATASHEAIRAILLGKRPARWETVESLVVTLASAALRGPDPITEAERLQKLWLAIVHEAHRKAGEDTPTGVTEVTREDVPATHGRKPPTRYEVRHALAAGDEFFFVMDPVFDLVDGRIVGAEGYIRWNHPRLGVCLPRDFLPVVEASGLTALVDWLAIDSLVATTARWARAGLVLSVSVNLFTRTFDNPRLAFEIGDILSQHNVPAERLTLETDETSFMMHSDEAVGILRTVREMGVRLALDDFGTGYSSLSYLRRLSIDEVKIDRSFISSLGDSRAAEGIVRAMVELGASLGFKAVGLGVETQTAADFLKACGCKAAQGYLFGRPALPDEILRRFGPTRSGHS